MNKLIQRVNHINESNKNSNEQECLIHFLLLCTNAIERRLVHLKARCYYLLLSFLSIFQTKTFDNKNVIIIKANVYNMDDFGDKAKRKI